MFRFPEFWNIFFGFIPYHIKEFQFFSCLQSSRILGISSENFARLMVACNVGLRVVECRRSWKFAKRASKNVCGSSAANEPFETFTPSEEFLHWEDEHFTDALALRSLRAAPGVWRLPLWEQAHDIDSECFSLLGSWSIKTRIPQRTHTQLYGTMCGILDSIHQIGAPPPQ